MAGSATVLSGIRDPNPRDPGDRIGRATGCSGARIATRVAMVGFAIDISFAGVARSRVCMCDKGGLCVTSEGFWRNGLLCSGVWEEDWDEWMDLMV